MQQGQKKTAEAPAPAPPHHRHHHRRHHRHHRHHRRKQTNKHTGEKKQWHAHATRLRLPRSGFLGMFWADLKAQEPGILLLAYLNNANSKSKSLLGSRNLNRRKGLPPLTPTHEQLQDNSGFQTVQSLQAVWGVCYRRSAPQNLVSCVLRVLRLSLELMHRRHSRRTLLQG